MAVATHKTPYGRHRVGQCSGFLSTVQPGDTVYLRIKRGAVHDTRLGTMISSMDSGSSSAEVSNVNMILVGPGTGIAPMRSIVQQYQLSRPAGSTEATSSGRSAAVTDPKLLVLFGCRKRNQDYLFGAEWEHLKSLESAQSSGGGEVAVEVAFSQDQAHKDYVSHGIHRHGALICRMVQQVGDTPPSLNCFVLF